jgi:hypothetical protein
MDEETKAYLDGMMAQINNQFDRVLDKMSAIRQDVETLHGHVIFGLQNNLTLGQRITKLEDEIRRRGGHE